VAAPSAPLAALRPRLGLPPQAGNALAGLRGRAVPPGISTAHLVSPRLLPVPGDWPAQLRNVGAPAVPAALRAAWGEGTVPPELRAWLDQGEPPVFFGFGSMPVLDPSSAVEMITGVAGRLGLRALIGAGWSGLAADVRDEKIFITERVDRDLVLPRCRATVHHGGAGTTHTVLRAGRFLAHVEQEQRHGRRCPADWSWIVPPTAGSTTPVFHRSYHDFDASPNFRRQAG